MWNVNAIYEYFNRAEAVAWFVVALGLPFWFRPASRRQRISLTVASGGFVLFGISDLCEAVHHGRLPLWLWGFKIACVSLLLACRYHYVGWNQLTWRDHRLRFAAACLLGVLLLIWLQQVLPS